MARIRLFHPSDKVAKELRRAGFIEENIFMKDVLPTVEKIFRETTLNIMIQKHGTEDCTIWVDDGRFRQR